MIVTFLGTGGSQGVPVIACQCAVCKSNDLKDKRLRTSVLIQIDDQNFIIDAGPDFRQQALREEMTSLEAIIFTHQHKDHTGGLDGVRAFNFIQKRTMPIFGTQRVINHLKKEFYYAFAENKYPGTPELDIHEIHNEAFTINGVELLPIEGFHHKLPVFGYRIGDFTYITDVKYIPPKELRKVKGSKVIVLNALRKEEHLSHFSLSEAINLVYKLAPEKAYFTHLSHSMGKHEEVSADLPENIFLAFDGLKIEI